MVQPHDLVRCSIAQVYSLELFDDAGACRVSFVHLFWLLQAWMRIQAEILCIIWFKKPTIKKLGCTSIWMISAQIAH